MSRSCQPRTERLRNKRRETEILLASATSEEKRGRSCKSLGEGVRSLVNHSPGGRGLFTDNIAEKKKHCSKGEGESTIPKLIDTLGKERIQISHQPGQEKRKALAYFCGRDSLYGKKRKSELSMSHSHGDTKTGGITHRRDHMGGSNTHTLLRCFWGGIDRGGSILP